MKTTTVTAAMKAWLPSHSFTSPTDLLAGKIDGLFYSNADMASSGWTEVGSASITLELIDTRAMIDNKVEALKQEGAAIRAEAYQKTMRIDEQIRNLLAISYDAPEVAHA